MKATLKLFVLLGCVLLASCGHSSSRSSSSSSSSSDESDSNSSEVHSTWFGNRFRSAGCNLLPAANSAVRGYIHLYQKREGEPIWIKGGFGQLGPAGTEYLLAFHTAAPTTPGACDGAGTAMSDVGGDIAHVISKRQNSGTGIRVQNQLISLVEGQPKSVMGKSIVVREAASGRLAACCTIERSRERH